jgi:hypothetical protein
MSPKSEMRIHATTRAQAPRLIRQVGGGGKGMMPKERLVRQAQTLLGSENAISRSNLPGRRSAGSMASTRFVAPITTTWPRPSSPSISASSVDTSDECTWSTFIDRTGARPSISSKKMMDGCILFASSNSSRSCRSASPTHFDKQSAPCGSTPNKHTKRTGMYTATSRGGHCLVACSGETQNRNDTHNRLRRHQQLA